jgi:hypothetical protein
VDEEGLADEEAKGFRGAGAEAYAGTGRRNEDRDVTASIELRGHVAVLIRRMMLRGDGNVRPR